MAEVFPFSHRTHFPLKPKRPHFTWLVCRGCIRGVCTLALWALWLGLAALLFMQARIAMSDEIAIPDAVLRNAEQRMAERGLRFTFGAIHCDASGHVLVRDLKLFSSRHPDPVLTVKAVRFEINPYALWVRNIAPRAAARIDGASFRMPAMLSSDGANAPVIDDIYAELEVKENTLFISGLTARFGNLSILCRGAAALPQDGERKRQAADILSDMIAAYLKAARQFDSWTARLAALDSPMLDVTLTPEAGRIASARMELTANSLLVAKPSNAKNAAASDAGDPPAPRIALGPLIARTTVELASLLPENTPADESQNPPSLLRIQLSTTDALWQNDLNLRARNARLALVVPMADALRLGAKKQDADTAGALPVASLSLSATADSFTARDITVQSVITRIRGRFPQKIHAQVTTRLLGEPVVFETEADFENKKAEASITTRATPEHIGALSRELKYDIGEILKPARPIGISTTARLDSGWRFTGAAGSLDIGAIDAHGVPVTRARGKFAYDHEGREIIFSPAMAVVGESFARGSFRMNFDTLDYRFLLAGRLRPPAINGWLGAWWPDFWSSFTFDGAAPFGDVDVQGNFRHADTARVFVFADAAALTYNKVALDNVVLSLFARPDYYDATDLFARRGSGYARGTFTHQRVDPGNRPVLTVLDFKAENLDPSAVAPAIAPEIAGDLALLQFEKPPARVRVAGRIDGPASPRGEHVLLDIDAEGNEPFTYDGIPFRTLSTSIRIRDDAFNIERLNTQFAGGHLDLKAKLSGTGAERRLGFDLDIRGANFGRASQLIEGIAARRRAVPAAPSGDYHKQPPGALLNLRLSAEGLLRDSLSFKGRGSSEITGAELVDVNVFGSLSQALRDVKVLNFTTLSLSNGQASFTLDGRRVIIPEAILTGQKAQVKLSGEYTLDTRFANLTAKVYPLSESKGILGRGLGFVLVPITHLTELKLTGSLDAPKWRFSYGPTSFIRAIAGKGSDTDSLEKEHVAAEAEAVEQKNASENNAAAPVAPRGPRHQ